MGVRRKRSEGGRWAMAVRELHLFSDSASPLISSCSSRKKKEKTVKGVLRSGGASELDPMAQDL